MDFSDRYDVAVAGGGIAGVAAALEAARCGARVALIEKTITLGGLATTGIVPIYLPLCDGNGRQIIFGLSEELLLLSLHYGPGELPAGWAPGDDRPRWQRYRVSFNPASYMLGLDEIVEAAGVTLWLDTLVTAAAVERGRLTALTLENKAGRGCVEAACFVDATGDADVAQRAGAPCATGRNWLSLWYIEADPAGGEPTLRWLGADANGRGQPDDVAPTTGLGPRDITDFVLNGRRILRRKLAEAGGDTYPVMLPAMAQLRTTRRILGRETMSTGQDFTHRPDSVGLAPDWRRAGPVWEVPYGALLPLQVDGLLAAGRCMASEGDAWEVMRVIPTAALTGQAAGAAAALSAQAGIAPSELPVAHLQAHLRGRGVRLHLEDVGLERRTDST